jgi:uncharacterized protein DUF433
VIMLPVATITADMPINALECAGVTEMQAYLYSRLVQSRTVNRSRPQERSMDARFRHRINLDLQVRLGKPVIRGTRIPIERIVRMLAQGIPVVECRRPSTS